MQHHHRLAFTQSSEVITSTSALMLQYGAAKINLKREMYTLTYGLYCLIEANLHVMWVGL